MHVSYLAAKRASRTVIAVERQTFDPGGVRRIGFNRHPGPTIGLRRGRVPPTSRTVDVCSRHCCIEALADGLRVSDAIKPYDFAGLGCARPRSRYATDSVCFRFRWKKKNGTSSRRPDRRNRTAGELHVSFDIRFHAARVGRVRVIACTRGPTACADDRRRVSLKSSPARPVVSIRTTVAEYKHFLRFFFYRFLTFYRFLPFFRTT